jgi:hypothetical protein
MMPDMAPSVSGTARLSVVTSKPGHVQRPSGSCPDQEAENKEADHSRQHQVGISFEAARQLDAAQNADTTARI